MSVTLKAVLNSLALESDRARRALYEGSTYSIPSLVVPQLIYGAPTTRGDVDARNAVVDPEGLGPLTDWSADGGAFDVTGTEVPPRWRRSVLVTATGGAVASVRVNAVARELADYYWMAIARTDHPAGVTGRLSTIAGAELSAYTVPISQGWLLLRGGPVQLTAGETYRISVSTRNAAATGQHVWMTAATLTAGVDPGFPFSGDSSPTTRNTFSWEGARNASPSLRHGLVVDLLRDVEQEREFNIVPEGLTWLQRREYLVGRLRAYNQSYATVLRDLLLFLIRTENPSASTTSVRIVESTTEYRFRVEIAYAETGPLAARVRQLVADVAPAHLQLEDIVWGAFQANINRAGDPV